MTSVPLAVAVIWACYPNDPHTLASRTLNSSDSPHTLASRTLNSSDSAAAKSTFFALAPSRALLSAAYWERACAATPTRRNSTRRRRPSACGQADKRWLLGCAVPHGGCRAGGGRKSSAACHPHSAGWLRCRAHPGLTPSVWWIVLQLTACALRGRSRHRSLPNPDIRRLRLCFSLSPPLCGEVKRIRPDRPTA